MKYILTIFSFPLIILFSSLDSDQSNLQLKETKKTNNIVNSNYNRMDTVFVQYKDTLHLEEKSNTKVVFVEKKVKPDYFKYVLPIITLLIGIATNRFLEYLTKRKKLQAVLKRWISEIRCLEKPLKKQISDLEKFMSNILEEIHTIPDMGIHALLKGEIFMTLEKGEYLDALEKVKNVNYKEAVNLSNRTHGFIQILSHYTNILQKKYDEYMVITERLTNELNSNMHHLQKSYAQYGVLLEKELKADPMVHQDYKRITNLFFSHIITPRIQGIDIPDIYKLEAIFFLPLLEVLTNNRLDEQISSLLEYTSSCLHNIQTLRTEKKIIHGSINQIKTEFESQLIEIQSIIDLVEK